ncbi:MAG: ATP-binding cassette domain-containing protein [Planctomycetes bacterium]|nr:ATP-binding cassette domain-containing protein [Planctomycetota bacterium]
MALELVGITKRFGSQTALDDLSLRVENGDCYGFIGHNGSGKTTAMRVALGLQRADQGVVIIDGFDATHFPREARARLGALIETPGFQGGWNGHRNLTELGRLQGLDRSQALREATRWIERVGLAHAGQKAVQNYSHGMRQRLGIAAALLGTPRYVLLDEPTNGLDPEGIAEMRELIQRLRREEGLTFLISSHQLHELGSICNRVGILRAGRLLVQDETVRLLDTNGSRWRLETEALEKARTVARRLQLTEVTGTTASERELWLDLGTHASSAVTRAFVEAGVDVVSFAARAVSLEEIYLKYSRTAQDTRGTRDHRTVSSTVSAAPVDRIAPKGPIARMTTFDLRRFARSFGLIVLFALPVLLAAIAVLRRGMQSRSEQSSIEGAELFSATGANAFEALGLALQAGLPALLFLVLGLSSQSLSAEYARGTLRNVLLRPLLRLQCAAGKWFALAVTTLAAYLLLAVSAFALSGALFEFGDVAEVLPNGQRFTLVPAAELWPVTWQALFSPVLPLLAYSALGFLAGAIARTGSGALGLALGAGVLLDLARALMREFGRGGLLPSDHLSSPLSDTSFMRFFVDTAQGVSNAAFEYQGAAIYVPILWSVVCFCLAAGILQRRAIP